MSNSPRVLTFKICVALILVQTASIVLPYIPEDHPPVSSIDLSEFVRSAIEYAAYEPRGLVGTGNVIEVGCYEGTTTRILARAFLRDAAESIPFSVYAFDVWTDRVEEKGGHHFPAEAYGRFLHNTVRKGLRVVPIRGHSQQTIPLVTTTHNLTGTVVFAYIDGEHTSEAVYADAVSVWSLLRSGGFVVFDDYNWQDWAADPINTPHAGIDHFISERVEVGDIVVVGKGYQIVVQKR